MKKTNWIIGAIILVVIVAGLFVYLNQKNENPLNNQVNQSIANKYPALKDNQFRHEQVMRVNDSWVVNGKAITLSENTDDFKFNCNNKEVTPILASSEHYSCPSDIEGCWSDVNTYIIDCGDFYLIYFFNDAGPQLFGPFTN